MFTGIKEETAQIIDKTNDRLVIKRPASFDLLLIGSSIAVSGVCLSVQGFDDVSMTFDVVEETWKKSKLGLLKKGDRVNLERSVLADRRLDGHVVQGHVEGVGTVVAPSATPLEEGILRIHLQQELIKFCIQKGSVAIDGVSLTIAELDRDDDAIALALVPHTLRNTTLGDLKEGDTVNIETDIVGRYLYAFTHEKIAR